MENTNIYLLKPNNIQFIAGSILILIYFTLLLAEQKWPLRKKTRSLLSRIVVNFPFTILVYLIAAILISPLVKIMIHKTQIYHFGLLAFLSVHGLLQFVTGFLLMDLTFYYWHWMNHKFPLLWRFHNVHHVDQDLDVTTSMRFHVVEIAYSGIFRIFQLGLIGINPLVFMCYEIVFQFNTFFHHSNIKLPFQFEKIINLIFVTPRMHGIHHSNYREETNRNFRVVFSFWDRIHRTIKLNIPQNSITIGIPGYSKPNDNKLINLLLMPFKKQHTYWKIKNKNHINRFFLHKSTDHLLE